MHRKIALPLWGCFLLGLLAVGTGLRGLAQELPKVPDLQAPEIKPFPPMDQAPKGPAAAAPKDGKDGANVPILYIRTNLTKKVGMSKNQLIREVRNENPTVTKVQSLLEDPRAVLITGLSTGTSRVTFTDVNGVTEFLDVKVSSQEEDFRDQQRLEFLKRVKVLVPTANIQAFPEPNNIVILTGWLNASSSTNLVLELARAYFPGATIINDMQVGGVQQVQLEVVVAVVNRSELRNMTFNWIFNRQDYFISSILSSPLTFTNTLTTGLASSAAGSTIANSNVVFGYLGDKSSFSGFLEALKTEKLAKVLSEPRVTTLSGRPAQIISGGETPVITTSGVGSPTVTYRSFGTIVSFLPIVLGNGKIHLEITPELSNINQARGIVVSGGSTIVPGFDIRRAQVTVQCEDGQTVAIGGLIQSVTNASVKRVPVLGDLPFLGTAFTSKSFEEVEEEMLILVTPRLIDPMACCQIPQYLPGRETRNPDDFELFLEGILEAPRGPRGICGPNGHYQAAHKTSATAGLYPCGDASHRWNPAWKRCVPGQAGCEIAPGTMPIAKESVPMLTPASMAAPLSPTPGSSIPASKIVPERTDPLPAPRKISTEQETRLPRLPAGKMTVGSNLGTPMPVSGLPLSPTAGETAPVLAPAMRISGNNLATAPVPPPMLQSPVAGPSEP